MEKNINLFAVLIVCYCVECASIIRRIGKVWYAPIYFAVPWGPNADEYAQRYLLVTSKVLGENSGLTLREIKKRLILNSLGGFLVLTWITPVVCGYIASLILAPREVWGVFATLASLQAYKVYLQLVTPLEEEYGFIRKKQQKAILITSLVSVAIQYINLYYYFLMFGGRLPNQGQQPLIIMLFTLTSGLALPTVLGLLGSYWQIATLDTFENRSEMRESFSNAEEFADETLPQTNS